MSNFYCPNCGREMNTTTISICPWCGTKIDFHNSDNTTAGKMRETK